MKIYFDESGQSGCILQKNDMLNFQNQPTFAIGAVVIPDERQINHLITKYVEFKEKFGIEGEIKGSDLLTRSRNAELEYVIENIFDCYHFFVLLYDKRFYISTLLLTSLVGFEYQHTFPVHFYRQATMLTKQSDEFFVRYLKFIENPRVSTFSEYLRFLINYDYIHMEESENTIVYIAQEILDGKIENKYSGNFLPFGWYENPKIANLINLNALSELIYFVKFQTGATNGTVVYVHDHIKEFEETIGSELREYGINIAFADSKQEVLLQVADNVASIARHAYDKAIAHFRAKEEWNVENQWDMNLMSHVIRKLSSAHISFTVPLYDWAAALCVETMFAPQYPLEYRNNYNFNFHYRKNLMQIFSSLELACRPLDEIMGLLNK